MKITLYTGIKDGFAQDLHAEAMLGHHLDASDRMVMRSEHLIGDDVGPANEPHRHAVEQPAVLIL